VHRQEHRPGQRDTAGQQAELEAKALWEKKLKKDYTLDPDVKSGDTSDLIEGGALPMLAKKYEDRKGKVSWPMMGQPKLDGHRCIAMVDAAGKCTLWSRTRKPILSMPHIVAAIEETGITDTILDGELYNHDYKDKFEQLTSLIRPEYAKPGHDIVHYHVYDMVSGKSFRDRNDWLQAWEYEYLSYTGYFGPLRLVDTWPVPDENAMRASFAKCIEDGYEGLMLRDPDSAYANKRSDCLLKVKERDDAEFKITGVEEGKGKLAGHGIFILETATGTPFRAKMKGETEKLKQYHEHPEQWIGRMVTVAYQGLTADGIPRFPVAIRIQETL
jgi:DNA ligase-1